MDAAAAAELAAVTAPAAAAGPDLIAEAALRTPAGLLGLVAVYELHRIRSVLDRVTERISRLEARFYATVTQRGPSETEP